MGVIDKTKGVLMPSEPEKAGGGKIGEKQIQEAWQTLMRYQADKRRLEQKIIANEQWWKLRHWESEPREDGKEPVRASAWLWNVIVSKHADAMDAFPEPNMLPRAIDDKAEAKKLTSIIPVILEQNDFRRIYSDAQWDKLKQGACIYGVFWDGKKHNGLGDISIKDVDGLSLFWEGGIKNIQDSKNIFYATLVDNYDLENQYPQFKVAKGGDKYVVPKYHTDDNVNTDGKTTVIDWYYHGYNAEGKRVLHFCKFAGSVVLFATENEPEKYPNGWYDHGMYPFVIDQLYTIKGTPYGYGHIDVNKGTQEQIDLLDDAVVSNALRASKTRYFIRGDGSVNEEEFADFSKDFVHTNGNLGEDSIKKIDVELLNATYHNLISNKINELKETSGNWDANNGGSTAGVTAASAIAAMQEAGGKMSRDSSAMSYDGFKQVIVQVIELIRQFYNIPRQFRITGEKGQYEFITYSNQGITPQQMSMDGVDIGLRRVEFDIDVVPQKATAYSKMAQNELAIQLYNLGVFDPQNGDRAMALLDAMDFEHKDKIVEKIQNNMNLQAQLVQLGQLALGLANKYEPQAMDQIMQVVQGGGAPAGGGMPMADPSLIENDQLGGAIPEEHGRVRNARAQSQESVMPN